MLLCKHHMSSYNRAYTLWRSLNFFRRSSLASQNGTKILTFVEKSRHFPPPLVALQRGLCSLSRHVDPELPIVAQIDSHSNVVSHGNEQAIGRDPHVQLVNNKGTAFNSNDGRVMLIDGTSIIYRAYYKLLAKLNHGYLTNADGNGDWVLTIFTALSLIIVFWNSFLRMWRWCLIMVVRLITWYYIYTFILLRSDLPFYMVPFEAKDLVFNRPEDNGDKFTSLLTAISAYAEGFSADPIIRRAFYLWKKLEKR